MRGFIVMFFCFLFIVLLCFNSETFQFIAVWILALTGPCCSGFLAGDWVDCTDCVQTLGILFNNETKAHTGDKVARQGYKMQQR